MIGLLALSPVFHKNKQMPTFINVSQITPLWNDLSHHVTEGYSFSIIRSFLCSSSTDFLDPIGAFLSLVNHPILPVNHQELRHDLNQNLKQSIVRTNC